MASTSRRYSLLRFHDVDYVVTEGLKSIPVGTRFHETIAGVIDLHNQYPDDWKRAWFEIQKKWAEDVGCADGVFAAFNIDARLNAAYVVLGLLYGKGDMTRTISIATRAGQDSDCNPSSAAGILGAIIGYSKIPAYWKQGLSAVEATAFQHAGLSLKASWVTFKHALEDRRNADGWRGPRHWLWPVGPFASAELASLPDRGDPPPPASDEMTFSFGDQVRRAEPPARARRIRDCRRHVNGRSPRRDDRTSNFTRRRFTPFWNAGGGKHVVRLKIRTRRPASVSLERQITEVSQAACREF